MPVRTDRPPRRAVAVRWALAAVAAAATTGLLLSPYGSPADRTGPLSVTAAVALATLVVLEARRPLLHPRPLAALACGLLVLAVVVPPRTSHDIWSYAMYGRIVEVHHADPYRTPPSAFPGDPALRRVEPVWRSARSVYGPAFTGISAGVSRIVGNDALATRVAYQSMAALAVGAVVLALARKRRTAAIAAVGLHPLVVVALVNGGHNDALVGLLLLAAALAARRPRPVLVGVAAGVAVLIKIVALLPALALVAWMLRRHGLRRTTVASGVLVGLVGVGYAAVGGAAALQPLVAAAGHVSRASLWRALPGSAHHGIDQLALLALLVAAPAAMATAARLHANPTAASVAGALPFLLAAPYVLPWYFAWVIPMAAFSDDRGLAVVVLGETLLVEVAYAYRPVAHPDALDRALHGAITAAQGFELVAIVGLVATAGVVLARSARDRRGTAGRKVRLGQTWRMPAANPGRP